MSIRSAEGDVYRAKDGCKTVINELKDLYEKAKTKTTSTTSKKADGGTKTKSRASAKRSTSKTGPTNEAEAGQKRMSVRKEGRKR